MLRAEANPGITFPEKMTASHKDYDQYARKSRMPGASRVRTPNNASKTRSQGAGESPYKVKPLDQLVITNNLPNRSSATSDVQKDSRGDNETKVRRDHTVTVTVRI